MSLLSSINLATNALHAQQVGLQVVAQNIANANTPGYIRQELVLSPAPTQRLGNLLLGLGVQVDGVVQRIDRFLEDRLRGASSDRAGSEVAEQAYSQLEAVIGELSDTDLSSSLNSFFASIAEILNQPESVSARRLAVLQGRTLAGDINRLVRRVRSVRHDLNERVKNVAGEINTLVSEIRELNVKIMQAEGSAGTASEAVGLRDQRGVALAKLAELIDIRTEEQPSGAVNVFSGGNFLVYEAVARHVELNLSSDRGLAVAEIRVVETDSPLELTAGELHGLYSARDEIYGGFIDTLDNFAGALAFEFNKLFSSGQGLAGFTELTGTFAIDEPTAALDAAGLPFTPTNGSFQVKVFDRHTGLTQTTDVFVNLDGMDDDTSLEELRAAIDSIDGVAASITATGRLRLESESTEQEFAFADDTSGVLAALGLNTFFTGSTADDLAVNEVLLESPEMFAASRSGIGGDTANAIELAAFLERRLESRAGATLGDLYNGLVSEVTQGAAVNKAVTEGFRVFEETLLGQHLSISGVSLDEEAIRLISYQRNFQAAARFIATLSDLLEMLVNL